MMGMGRPPRPLHRDFDKEPERVKLRDIKMDDIRFIFKFIRNHRIKLILAILFTLATSIIGVFPPLLSQRIIDEFVVQKDIENIIRFSAFIISLYLITWFTSYFQNRLSTKVAQSVITDLRHSVFRKILASSMKYNTESKRGERLSVVTNDVNALSETFTSGVISIISDSISLVLSVAIMFSLDWIMTLVTLVFIPLVLLGIKKIRKKIRKTFLQIRVNLAQLNANVEENISGIRVVQSLAAESKSAGEFTDLSNTNLKMNMKSVYLFSLFQAIVSISGYIAIAVVISVGGIRFIGGGLSLGILVAFLQYINKVLRPFMNLTELANTFDAAFAALIHITEHMKEPIDVPEPEFPINLPDPCNGVIELKGASFSYTKEPFMQDINLKIDAGERIGIVGETGAGKSTLISLITRLYDVKDGLVSIDGVNIKAIANKDLRSIMAVVSQDVMLFSDTIMNNIRFGNPDADDESVIEAAILANADDFIRDLHNGYNTILGERGTGISGGQKQLISYARMILAKPKIVILDEATSNIDSYTEDLIQSNMRTLLKDCTTIVIAHRFATLKAVDKIILVKDGGIDDFGTHDELLMRNAFYKQLFEEQYSKM